MVLQEFSIKDLESLTGIKAHTIRIWERRYTLLSPSRSQTNIRSYSGEDVKRLLNVSLLQKNGFKISKIALMHGQEMGDRLRAINGAVAKFDHCLAVLKVAIMNFDEPVFREVSETYLKNHSFESLFEDLYLPLLVEVGFLWQTGTICPAQEHFASNLIRQFVFHHTQLLPCAALPEAKTFIFYLPDREIHELSLMMFHFLARQRGHHTVYLGISVPVEDLVQVTRKFTNAELVCTMVGNTAPGQTENYVQHLRDLFAETDAVFHFTGSQVAEFVSDPQFRFYPEARALLAAIMA